MYNPLCYVADCHLYNEKHQITNKPLARCGFEVYFLTPSLTGEKFSIQPVLLLIVNFYYWLEKNVLEQ